MQDTTARPATARDAYMQDFAADLKECRAADLRKIGRDDEADHCAEEARPHRRSAWIIRRHLNAARVPSTPPIDAPRTSAVATPRERRARRASSPTRAGPDDDSESSEPPPRRLCAFCGKDIPAARSPKATHCSDRHADRDRQRRRRQRDRARSKLPPTPTTADFWRMLQLSDEERDWLRALVVCRCNGRHLEFDPGECFRCGRHLPHGREAVAA